MADQRSRIYYVDGSHFTIPDNGRVEDAPREGVLIVIWDDNSYHSFDDLGRHFLESYDYYMYSDHIGAWHGTNKTHDVLMHIRKYGCGPGGVRTVLIGEWTTREKWQHIKNVAIEDQDFRERGHVCRMEDGSHDQ